MGRTLFPILPADTGPMIGEMVQLANVQPGYLPCDGLTVYTEGRIFNDLLSLTQLQPTGLSVSTTTPLRRVIAGRSDVTGLNVMLALAGGIYVSGDGVAWTPVVAPTNSTGGTAWNALSFDGSKFFAFEFTDDGIYYSTSTNGINWAAFKTIRAKTGTTTLNAYTVVTNPDTGALFVFSDAGGGYYSKDGGTTWTKSTLPANLAIGNSTASCVAFGQHSFMLALVSTSTPANNKTLVSNNDGATFVFSGIPVNAVSVLPAIGTSAGTLVGIAKTTANSNLSIVRSIDGGLTWDYPGFAWLPSMAEMNSSVLDATVMSCRHGGSLFIGKAQSDDDGKTWFLRGRQLAPATISAGWHSAAASFAGVLYHYFVSTTAVVVASSGALTGVGVTPNNSGYFLRVK